MYELRCLGEASLRNASGDLIRFRSRKHLALLIYLSLNAERAHRRERLAGLLWSESDDSRARHSLSQALYAVRRTLNAAIRIEGEELEISGGDLWVDSIELEKRLKSGDPVGASEMYRGDFLEGFWIRGGHGFEDWAERERARVGALARDAFRRAIKVARDRCEWSEVTARAERLVQLDPFDEAAYAELMRALWMVGDRARALERYEELRRVLADELGSSPSAETEDLVARIRSRPVRGGWSERRLLREAEPTPFDNPPFVGRKKELAILAEEWERVKAGETRAVALVGEAGIGKTRLANEFIESLALEDVVVLRGRCYEAEQSLPYGPVAEALRDGMADLDLTEVKPLWLAELARIVPEVEARYGSLPEPPALEADGGRRRLYEGIAQVLKAVCEARPVMLLVDDLHWADESSIALLHYLLRRVSGGLYLLTAHRPEELGAPNKWPKVGLLALLDNLVRTLPLDALDRPESVHLLSALIAVDADTLCALESMSEGNPFFAIELAKGTMEDPHSLPPLSVPSGIKTLFNRKIAALSGRTQAFLEQAAVLGSRIAHEALQAAVGLEPLEIRPILREAAGAGILSEDKNRVSFRHDLIREIIMEQVPVGRMTGLHSKAARALIRSGGSASEIARHFSAGGDDRRAYAYALRGAKQAEQVFAMEEAAEQLKLAMALAQSEAVRVRLMGRLGKLYWHTRNHDEARPLLAERLDYVVSHKYSRIETIKCRRDLVFFDADSGRADLQRSAVALSNLYDELFATSADVFTLKLEILYKLFWTAACGGNARLAEETIAKITNLDPLSAGQVSRWRGLRILGIYQCYKGDLVEAEKLLRESLKCAREMGDKVALVECYVGLTVLAHRSARTDMADEIVNDAVPLAEDCGDPSIKARLLCNCAACYMHLGDTCRAQTLLNSARQALIGVGYLPGDISAITSNLAYLEFLKGNYEQAEMYWLKALDTNLKAGLVAQHIDNLAALGNLALRRGQLTLARSYAAQALRLAKRADPYLDERHALEELLARTRFLGGHRRKALRRLAELAASAESRDVLVYLRAQLTRLEFLAQEGLTNDAQLVKRDLCEFARLHGATWYVEQAEHVDIGVTAPAMPQPSTSE